MSLAGATSWLDNCATDAWTTYESFLDSARDVRMSAMKALGILFPSAERQPETDGILRVTVWDADLVHGTAIGEDVTDLCRKTWARALFGRTKLTPWAHSRLSARPAKSDRIRFCAVDYRLREHRSATAVYPFGDDVAYPVTRARQRDTPPARHRDLFRAYVKTGEAEVDVTNVLYELVGKDGGHAGEPFTPHQITLCWMRIGLEAGTATFPPEGKLTLVWDDGLKELHELKYTQAPPQEDALASGPLSSTTTLAWTVARADPRGPPEGPTTIFSAIGERL